MPKTLRLISWNVNGIRAVLKKGDFRAFIEAYEPDVLCLQETKAKQGQAEVDLPDYEEYWNSAEKAGYSGTAIFSKEKPLSVLYGFADGIAEKFKLGADEYGDPTKEGRVVSAEFADFWVVTAYVPNSKEDLSRVKLRQKHWDPAFLAHVKFLEKSKPVLASGDFNVAHTEDDLANPAQNVGKHGFTDEERAGFQAFLDAGFLDTFRLFTKGKGHYSWWSHWANARARNVGWRIDYWLASSVLKKRIKSAAIHAKQMGSDHCPVEVVVSI